MALIPEAWLAIASTTAKILGFIFLQ